MLELVNKRSRLRWMLYSGWWNISQSIWAEVGLPPKMVLGGQMKVGCNRRCCSVVVRIWAATLSQRGQAFIWVMADSYMSWKVRGLSLQEWDRKGR